jgi:hypothetical protein
VLLLCKPRVFAQIRAFRGGHSYQCAKIARQLNEKISSHDSYECSPAVCAAVAGNSGRATMYATLALASINNAAT